MRRIPAVNKQLENGISLPNLENKGWTKIYDGISIIPLKKKFK